jgi:hypothetical protein
MLKLTQIMESWHEHCGEDHRAFGRQTDDQLTVDVVYLVCLVHRVSLVQTKMSLAHFPTTLSLGLIHNLLTLLGEGASWRTRVGRVRRATV